MQTEPLLSSRHAADELRHVIGADAALCAVSGAALVGLAAPLADLVGLTGGGGPLVGVGTFLLVLAAGLAWLRRAPHDTLLRLTPASAGGDLVWAAASVVVAVTVSMNLGGRAAVVVQAAAVAGVGLAKLRARRLALPS